ncbi:MAG: hypothetical protein HY986_02470 [Candidatus Melainabacteria bacterium]|nr:hypothetical protein [Candidatus Melainabacteria bacterium]
MSQVKLSLQEAALAAKKEFEEILAAEGKDGPNPRVLIPSDQGRDSLVPSPTRIGDWKSWGVIGYSWHSLHSSISPEQMIAVLRKHLVSQPVYLGPTLPAKTEGFCIERSIPWGKNPLQITIEQVAKGRGNLQYCENDTCYDMSEIELQDGQGFRRSLTLQVSFSRKTCRDIFNCVISQKLRWYMDIYLVAGVEKRGYPWLTLDAKLKSKMRMTGLEIAKTGAFYKGLIDSLNQMMEEVMDAYTTGRFDHEWLGDNLGGN